MKKMFIAGIVFCAALASQAAIAKWSITSIVGTESVTPVVGWVACIYEGNAADFTYEAAKSGTLVAADTQYTTENTSGAIRVNNSTGFGDFVAGSEHTMYAVIFDATTIDGAKNYIVSSDLTKTFAANGSAATFAFGNMSVTTTANKFLNSSWQSVNIPEPTSGLLLLVGGALLALRRKQK